MIDTLQAWDEALLLWFNGNPLWMHSAAWILTAKWTTFPVVLLILVKLLRQRDLRKGLLGLGLFLACIGGTDAISSRLMKPGFERLRPSHNPNLSEQLILHTHSDGTVYKGGSFGMVSSHAANTFGIATLVILLFGGHSWRWLWLWAAIVSWTRIYLGVHYPADIVLGALFGIGWAGAIFQVSHRFKLLKPEP